jgi:hypothetical protein
MAADLPGLTLQGFALQDVLYGAYACGFLVAAAFFLRFWQRKRAPLLLIFSLSFALLAVSYGLLGAAQIPREEQSWIYLIRLAAFMLIIIGIIWTNIRGSRP